MRDLDLQRRAQARFFVRAIAHREQRFVDPDNGVGGGRDLLPAAAARAHEPWTFAS
jgi:hypothetical protein